jgi:hypothetical protein
MGGQRYKKGQECVILTDEITKAWSGFNVKQYKVFKASFPFLSMKQC